MGHRGGAGLQRGLPHRPRVDRLFESVHLQCEVLVVVDSEEDTTVPAVTEYALKEPWILCVINTYGRGPANAIRSASTRRARRWRS